MKRKPITDFTFFQVMEHRWNEIDRGNQSTRGKTCASVTLPTINPTSTEAGSNPRLHGGRPATNRLSHGTAITANVKSVTSKCGDLHVQLDRAQYVMSEVLTCLTATITSARTDNRTTDSYADLRVHRDCDLCWPLISTTNAFRYWIHIKTNSNTKRHQSLDTKQNSQV